MAVINNIDHWINESKLNYFFIPVTFTALSLDKKNWVLTGFNKSIYWVPGLVLPKKPLLLPKYDNNHNC